MQEREIRVENIEGFTSAIEEWYPELKGVELNKVNVRYPELALATEAAQLNLGDILPPQLMRSLEETVQRFTGGNPGPILSQRLQVLPQLKVEIFSFPELIEKAVFSRVLGETGFSFPEASRYRVILTLSQLSLEEISYILQQSRVYIRIVERLPAVALHEALHVLTLCWVYSKNPPIIGSVGGIGISPDNQRVSLINEAITHWLTLNIFSPHAQNIERGEEWKRHIEEEYKNALSLLRDIIGEQNLQRLFPENNPHPLLLSSYFSPPFKNLRWLELLSNSKNL